MRWPTILLRAAIPTALVLVGLAAHLGAQVIPQPGPPTPIGCAYNTTPPTLTNAQAGWVQCDSTGHIAVVGTLSGAVTIADGADVAEGTTTDIACTTDNGTCTEIALIKRTNQRLTTINTTLGTPIQATGGTVGLVAGTAIVGKVGIDVAMTGITPIPSTSAEASHVLKASAGTLWSVYATNLTATAGFLVVLNATSAPVDGAITPLDCVPLPANGAVAVNYNSGPPATYSTGITAVLTSATTCFTKTTGVITGFIKGQVN